MNKKIKNIYCRGILVAVFITPISPLICEHCDYEHAPHIVEISPMANSTGLGSTFTAEVSGFTSTITTSPPYNN